LLAIDIALILVVNLRRKRAIALSRSQLEPDERGSHALQYGDNCFLMANITSPSESIWRNLFWYGEYQLSGRQPYGGNCFHMAIFSG